jgi:hypothetical protein
MIMPLCLGYKQNVSYFSPHCDQAIDRLGPCSAYHPTENHRPCMTPRDDTATVNELTLKNPGRCVLSLVIRKNCALTHAQVREVAHHPDRVPRHGRILVTNVIPLVTYIGDPGIFSAKGEYITY